MAESSTSKDKQPEVKSPTKKKSKKGLLFILLGVAVLIAAVAGYFLLRPKTSPSDPKAKISYSKSFFIYDSGKYTLWNADGKRLTDDDYDYKSDFVAGYAYVEKDNQSAIIREDGSVTVPFGKYGNIQARGGLFLAQDGNTKEYHVLTGSGKDLMVGQGLSLTSSGSNSGFALVKSEGAYDLFTYSGQHLGTFQKTEDSDEPKLAANSDFGAFYYNNFNLIFDSRDGHVLASFEDSRYEFEDISDDRTQVLLQNEEDETKYKLLAGGRVYDLNECKYYAFTVMNQLIGYESYSEIAVLNPDYTVATRTKNSSLALKDTNDYAIKNEDGNVEIHHQGQVVKTFENSSLESGVLYEDMYAIETDGKAMFYRLDGSVAINHEYQTIWSLFNKFHHAIVADTDNEYYLIDRAGNRVTEGTYSRISAEDGGYELKNSEGKYAIANTKGEILTEHKYESLYYRSTPVDHDIWTGRYDTNDYDVINVSSKRILAEHVNAQSFSANYFTVKNSEGKIEYYTYAGQHFYTAGS